MDPLWGLYDINGRVIELGNLGDEDVDIENQATSAFQYLRQVRKEASLVPEVVACNLPQSKLTSAQCRKNEILPSVLTPVPKTYLPSLKLETWHSCQFAQLCQKILREKSLQTIENEIRQDLPQKGDERGWHIFCYGKQISHSNSSGASCDEENHENKEDSGHVPTLDIMLQLNQPLIVQLLQYHLRWLMKHGLTMALAQWFYALLACLEKPLVADISSLLRIIAKRLADLRASLDSPDDDCLPLVNTLISIIVRNFGQTDLVD